MSLESKISPENALRKLEEGNARFVRGEPLLKSVSHGKVAELAQGQYPFATVLGCSDSRVAPEWIFDTGLGDLFVVRVAGNVLSPEVAGSIQYAVSHLRTPLLVVLGHEGCGAIGAALETKYSNVRQRSRIQLLVDSILPAIAGVDPALPPEVRLAQAVEANVRWSVRMVLESPEGRARLAEGGIRIAGAIYEIATGRVRFLDP